MRQDIAITGPVRATLAIAAMCFPLVMSTVPLAAQSGSKLSEASLERVYSVAKDFVLAQQIAKRCRGEFRVKSGARRTVEAYLLDIGKKEGLNRRQMGVAFKAVPAARVQKDVLAYIARRDIVMAERATWCAAGRAEIKDGGQISHFLSQR